MTQNLEISTIENPEKYAKDVRFTMNQIMSNGATVFKSLQEKGSIKQGMAFLTNGAFYQLQPQQASD